MSDKVVKTIQAIAETPERIEDISKSSSEYYFRFKGHVFSIHARADKVGLFVFYVYPHWSNPIEELAGVLEYDDYSGIKIVSYESSEYDDEGEPFRNLYAIVKNSYGGVDEIFDDILGNSAN